MTFGAAAFDCKTQCDLVSAQYIFDMCFLLSSITIPGNVTIIEAGAFSNCIFLREVNISSCKKKI